MSWERSEPSERILLTGAGAEAVAEGVGGGISEPVKKAADVCVVGDGVAWLL